MNAQPILAKEGDAADGPVMEGNHVVISHQQVDLAPEATGDKIVHQFLQPLHGGEIPPAAVNGISEKKHVTGLDSSLFGEQPGERAFPMLQFRATDVEIRNQHPLFCHREDCDAFCGVGNDGLDMERTTQVLYAKKLRYLKVTPSYDFHLYI